MTDVGMPRLSDSMIEGTIVRWLKSDGDQVARGDELVEIETDKATMVYEASADGIVHLLASEGETLPVGAPIARVRGENEPAPSAQPLAPAPVVSGKDVPDLSSRYSLPAPPEHGLGAHPDADHEADVNASPVARRMARERGLDLSGVTGTGPGGRIVKRDVERAAERPAEALQGMAGANTTTTAGQPGPRTVSESTTANSVITAHGTNALKGEVTVEQHSRTQQVIARRMAEAKAAIPEFALQARVNMHHAVDLRERLTVAHGGSGSPVPSLNDMIVKACALALKEHPRANGSFRDGHVEWYSRINVGVAVAAQDAVLVPTIFDADTKSLSEIARDTRALAQRARDGRITPAELAGGTFTVSNLGMYGVNNFTAIINGAQAAILAVGEIEGEAVITEGKVRERRTMRVTLTCDHRILYGADAARFLGRVRELLEAPLLLLL